MKHYKNRAQLLVRLSDPGPHPLDNDSPELTSPKAIHHHLDSHSLVCLTRSKHPGWPNPADPPSHLYGRATGLRRIPDTFLPTPDSRQSQKPGDRIMDKESGILCLGSLPSPTRRVLWIAICSSLRNSSSLTSGSGLAKPEWKISEANGVAMQKPEPRTQPWSG